MDVGVTAMFCHHDRVGYFAIDPTALSANSPDALFRLLVTMTIFQRRSDRQIMRVLHGMSYEDAFELWERTTGPHKQAITLVGAISRAWRISEKVAAMYLSALTNQYLSGELASWVDGVNSNHFVVIYSNVYLFLKGINYREPITYRARRAFLQSLAACINLNKFHPSVRRYNPRVVQQALYTFMSERNRRANKADWYDAPDSYRRCPQGLASYCCLNTTTVTS